MGESGSEDEVDKSGKVDEIKGESGEQVGGGGYEVRDRLLHPWGGDKSDPDRVDGEEGWEGLEKEFNIHELIVAKLGGDAFTLLETYWESMNWKVERI